ncbi:dual specificity protein phosphatase 15-like [Crotalus adamanteus]|uniref:Dual specificity protein phosphatase 15-like n=1 Tax=Crotalus adamanteus TaxID=8729 RepID=A0AAW1BTY4_CROAD
MAVTPLGWLEALEAVKAVRPVANPNLGFRQQLEEFGRSRSIQKIRRKLQQCHRGTDPFNDTKLSEDFCHLAENRSCPAPNRRGQTWVPGPLAPGKSRTQARPISSVGIPKKEEKGPGRAGEEELENIGSAKQSSAAPIAYRNRGAVTPPNSHGKDFQLKPPQK